MTDEPDNRSRAERRLDARREAQGLPAASRNRTRDRIIEGVAAAALGTLLLAKTDGIGVLLGVALWVFAVYQLATAAIAQGVKEGRSDK